MFFDELFSLVMFSTESLPPWVKDVDRLRAVGNHLFELGSLPTTTFREVLHGLVVRRRAQSLRTLEQLASRKDLASYYRQDIERWLHAVRKTIVSPQDAVCVELEGLYGREQGELAFKNLTANFGQLLAAWPTIIEGTKKLRSAGVSLAQPM
jgi:hypothetical protein